jgi:hypothetical protein
VSGQGKVVGQGRHGGRSGRRWLGMAGHDGRAGPVGRSEQSRAVNGGRAGIVTRQGRAAVNGGRTM